MNEDSTFEVFRFRIVSTLRVRDKYAATIITTSYHIERINSIALFVCSELLENSSMAISILLLRDQLL
jgi:hypothetical protein